MPLPPLRALENFATILRGLCMALHTRKANGLTAASVIGLIMGRIIRMKFRFDGLIVRLQNGTYRPRRFAGRRKSAARKPRRKNPLPQKFGWLLTLVPESVGYRSQLDHLLRNEPEMTALMQAAPAPMARLLRPLCWMLFITPPPILARPRRPAAPAPAATPAPAKAARRPRQPPAKPRQPTTPPSPPAPPVVPRACGPPKPA